ncbi:MAG: hypothetical protein K0S33_2726 [Bacteroidetes bacterium]|jgi:hypothetical protein|nr:hypothetical protein [Bacteroidota bacterium]
MQKYYTHNGTAQSGPFSLEELKSKIITKETPIWYEGLSEWKKAGEIEELNDLFKISGPPPFGETKSMPPPIQKTNEQTQQKNPINATPPKGNNSLPIILIGVVVVVIIIVAMVMANLKKSGAAGNEAINNQTYQEKVMTVEEIEQADPARFLDASGTYRENLWGDAMKVEGTITNKATVANYKDVVVEVIFYSETDTELDRKQYTIFEYFPAHSTTAFKLKLNRPQACKKLGWNAIIATPY